MLTALFAALLWGFLGLLALILVVAAAPVVLRARLRTTPELRLRLQISPLGGAAPWLTLADKRRSDLKPKRPPARGRKRKRKTGLASRIARRMLRHAPRLVAEILRLFRFRKLFLNARFGMPDPADTGTVFGLLCPLIYAAPDTPRLSVTLVPDYGKACFAGRIDASGSIVPLRLIPVLARFAWRAFGPRRVQ